MEVTMITLEQAKELSHGTILYHRDNRNSDGSPQRWKVNGKPKTWVRTPSRVSVPLKHGLWAYGYLTENDLELLFVSEKEALGQDLFDEVDRVSALLD